MDLKNIYQKYMVDQALLRQNLNQAIKETNFPGLGERRQGKVRDIYIQENKIILVATDRYSAFDRNLALVPFKGQALTQTSLFWFEQTKDIVANHVLANPDPNIVVAKQCQVIPIEVVVRGYITGVTDTALWTNYQKGQRDFGGFVLPEGMKKNQKLDTPVLTPTTKSDEHDKPISGAEIVSTEIVPAELWQQIEKTALALFHRGQEIAFKHGLILVDTKYEFGLDEKGELILIDEIHTPDSSRYWQAATYEVRFDKNEEPEYFDKEFLRLWFKENSDPYKDEVLPQAPEDMVIELASRYIKIYEQITGLEFKVDVNVDPLQRMEQNLNKFLS